MKSDREIMNRIRAAIDDCTQGIDEMPTLQYRIMQKAKGEEPVVRKIGSTVILTFVLLLLATGLAFAATNGFGILNFHPEQVNHSSYTEQIMELEQTWDGECFSATVHEAVFDGAKLSFTLSIAPKENADPVFVIPRIQAMANGAELPVFEQASSGGYQTDGFWIPNLEPDHASDFEQIGMDILMMSEDGMDIRPTQDTVEWTLTFDVLRPEWPILYTKQDEPGIAEEPWTDEEYRLYDLQFVKAYEEKHILLNRAAMLSPFAAAIPHDISIEDGQESVDWSESLLTQEAFKLKDKIMFRFSTEPLPVKKAKEMVSFDLPDGIHVELLDLTASTSQVSLSFRMTRTDSDEPLAMKDWGDRTFAILAKNTGTAMESASCGMREDGSLLFHGQYTLTGNVDTLIVIPAEETQALVMMREQAVPEERQGSAVYLDLE